MCLAGLRFCRFERCLGVWLMFGFDADVSDGMFYIPEGLNVFFLPLFSFRLLLSLREVYEGEKTGDISVYK